MSRIGNVQSKGSIRFTGATPPVILGNSGAFAEPVVRTGVGVWEVTTSASARVAPQDTFKARAEIVGAPANVTTTVERVSQTLLRVRAWNGATGAATDAQISLNWRTVLKG
jgi:hypothetical protein